MSICLAAVLLAACAVMGSTPEAQLIRGAETHTAATNLTISLLQRNKITVTQAGVYRGMLGTASAALDSSAAALRACRAISGPTVAAPDPCQQNVTADVNLALAVLTEIEKTLQTQAAK
jgi:hypothetical protein